LAKPKNHFKKEDHAMKNAIVGIVVFAQMLSLLAHAQNPNLENVNWQKGPSIGNLADVAQVRIPMGYVFAEANDTRTLLETMQNPTSGNELGFITPATFDWFVVFEFDNIGYVRDDEKNSLDADAILESIRKSTEASNKERRRRGWPILTVLGWEQPPHYNETTHNLEWAIRGQSKENLLINYNTRLLGRSGVMRVTLVTDPATLSAILPKFKKLIAGFQFKQGQQYAEYRQGDKLAKYGLTALVVGGASAVAVKTGLFKWIWKGLVVGFIAIFAFLKRLFSRIKPQKDPHD
jgi:uncharacterized membrane-anchored protein